MAEAEGFDLMTTCSIIIGNPSCTVCAYSYRENVQQVPKIRLCSHSSDWPECGILQMVEECASQCLQFQLEAIAMTNMESHLQLPIKVSLGLYTQLNVHRVFLVCGSSTFDPKSKMILLIPCSCCLFMWRGVVLAVFP